MASDESTTTDWVAPFVGETVSWLGGSPRERVGWISILILLVERLSHLVDDPDDSLVGFDPLDIDEAGGLGVDEVLVG